MPLENTPAAAANVTFRVSDLQVEHLRRAFGIGTDRPRLSWQVVTPGQNWRQAAAASTRSIHP